MSNLALYIHWPFCKSKCPYCDFNSHVTESVDHSHWKTAFLNEIDRFSEIIKNKNISSLNISYFNNKNAWITLKIFYNFLPL